MDEASISCRAGRQLFKTKAVLVAQTQLLSLKFRDMHGGMVPDFEIALDFYGTEILVGNLYRVFGERIGSEISDLHIFYGGKSLSVDVRTWQGEQSPLEIFKIEQFLQEKKNLRWGFFDNLVRSEVGLIDAFSFLLYDRLCNIISGFPDFVYGGEKREIILDFMTKKSSGITPSAAAALFSAETARAFTDSVKSAQTLTQNTLLAAGGHHPLLIKNLKIESAMFKLTAGFEDVFYDLGSLFARTRLSDVFPLIQHIGSEHKNLHRDLRESKVRLLKSFVTDKHIDTLDGWFSSTKRHVPDFYDSKSGVIVAQTYKESPHSTLFLVYGDGSCYVMYDFAKDRVFFDRMDDFVQGGDTVYFLQQLYEWNPRLKSVCDQDEMSNVSLSFKFRTGQAIGAEFDELVREFSDYVEPLDAAHGPRDLMSVKKILVYKKVSNYERDINDVLRAYVQRANLSTAELGENRTALRDALFSFLVEMKRFSLEKAQQSVEAFMQSVAEPPKRKCRDTIDEGVYIYLLARRGQQQQAESESFEYECVVRTEKINARVLFHCLFFVNNMLSVYILRENAAKVSGPAAEPFAKVSGPAFMSIVAPPPPDDSLLQEQNENNSISVNTTMNNFLAQLGENRLEGAGKKRPKSFGPVSRKVSRGPWKPLTNLQQFDPETYKGVSEGKSRGYSSLCQTTAGRVPIVFGTEAEFRDMIRTLKTLFPETAIEEMLRGDKRFYEEARSSEGERPSRLSERNGYALRHGNAFFICPEAFCTVHRIPLLLRQLEDLNITDDQGKPATLDAFFAAAGVQRRFRVSGRCPVCKTENERLDSVYINPYLLGRQGYPGFLESENKDKKRVCCFKQPVTARDPVLETIDGVSIFSMDGAQASEMKPRPSAPPKISYIVPETAFCKAGGFGLLSPILSRWFNSGLEMYSGVVRNMAAIQTYKQFLRKGVGWSQGTLTNLVDLVYDILRHKFLHQRNTQMDAEFPLEKNEKISHIVEYLQSLGDFSQRFRESAVSEAFTAPGYVNSPEEAFFLYLQNQSAWDEDILFPLLVALPIFPHPLVIVTFEGHPPPFFLTQDKYPETSFSVKSFGKIRKGRRVTCVFVQKMRVSTLSDVKIGESFVRGGFLFERIVMLEQRYSPEERKNSRREVDAFDLHAGEYGPEPTHNLQQILDGVERLQGAQGNRDLSARYLHYEHLEKVLHAQEKRPSNERLTMECVAQILDVRFRCTHVLVRLRKNQEASGHIWLPVYPRNPVVALAELSFWKRSDRKEIRNYLLSLEETNKVLDELSTLFGAAWPYHERRAIVRNIAQSPDADVYRVTGIQLNDVAYTYVRGQNIDVDARTKKFGIKGARITDNFMFDYFVVAPSSRAPDFAHRYFEEQIQREYDWRLLQYYFSRDSKPAAGAFPAHFIEFATRLPWAEDHFPMKRNPITVEGREIFCLSIYNRILVKRLYKEYTESKFMRALYDNGGALWEKPDASRYLRELDQSLFFYYYQWKNRVIDYLIKNFPLLG